MHTHIIWYIHAMQFSPWPGWEANHLGLTINIRRVSSTTKCVILSNLPYFLLTISLPCSGSLLTYSLKCTSVVYADIMTTYTPFFAHITPQNSQVKWVRPSVPCYPSKLGNQLSCQQQQHGHVVSWAHWERVPQWKDPAQLFQKRLDPGIPTSSSGTSLKLLDKLPHKPHAQNFGLTKYNEVWSPKH